MKGLSDKMSKAQHINGGGRNVNIYSYMDKTYSCVDTAVSDIQACHTISYENESPRTIDEKPLPIPCSKWIVVKGNESCVSEQVFNAKLIYRRS